MHLYWNEIKNKELLFILNAFILKYIWFPVTLPSFTHKYLVDLLVAPGLNLYTVLATKFFCRPFDMLDMSLPYSTWKFPCKNMKCTFLKTYVIAIWKCRSLLLYEGETFLVSTGVNYLDLPLNFQLVKVSSFYLSRFRLAHIATKSSLRGNYSPLQCCHQIITSKQWQWQHHGGYLSSGIW